MEKGPPSLSPMYNHFTEALCELYYANWGEIDKKLKRLISLFDYARKRCFDKLVLICIPLIVRAVFLAAACVVCYPSSGSSQLFSEVDESCPTLLLPLVPMSSQFHTSHLTSMANNPIFPQWFLQCKCEIELQAITQVNNSVLLQCIPQE